MAGLPDEADLHVPDGTPVDEALIRTTDLGVGAHPDDLELLALGPIGEGHLAGDRWFTGVTCTDGARSIRAPDHEALAEGEYVALRRDEQRAAADLGGYSAIVQLAHPSAQVRSPSGFERLAGELAALVRATAAVNVFTHDLADRHPTHVAVACATVRAIRSLPPEDRPSRLVGCEGWRSLDWLSDEAELRFDVGPHLELGDGLLGVYRSQVTDEKRYDAAVRGRLQANATFHDPRAADATDAVAVAMDLTPLIRNDDLDPRAFLHAAIERFGVGVDRGLAPYFG